MKTVYLFEFWILSLMVKNLPMTAEYMATNLAKWWRTKFLNGYKQFSVVPTDCSDGRPSDTEELLGRQEPTAFSDKEGPPEANQNSKSESRPLKFEEFECDVSLEGGVNASGQERKEFSFTLYDFDGHGKITKDDITGLVKTIYDTLGSSIKVPHFGSKTIKVKLTVAPDQRKCSDNREGGESEGKMDGERQGDNLTNNTKTNQKVKFKRDLKLTIRESRPQRFRRRRAARESCSSSSRSSDNNEECAADISEDEDDEVGMFDSDDDDRVNSLGNNRESPLNQTSRSYHSSPRYRHDVNRCSSPAVQRHHSKKQRSSSLQREELLQIIQANMDKNNLSFQPVRKQWSGLDGHRHSHHRRRKEETSGKSHHHFLNQLPGNCADFQTANSCYLDLAGLELQPKNSFCHYEQDCQYDKLFGAVVCRSKHSSIKHHLNCRNRGHHRSRSHDLSTQPEGPFQYHLLDSPIQNGYHPLRFSNPQHMRTKSSEYKLPQPFRHDKKIPQTVLGHSSSPHHLKHRNREQDQARAMAQVVRWLEQEFSNMNTANKLNHKGMPSAEDANKPTETPNKPAGTPKKSEIPEETAIERHEHHHIHEHVHHHYHHYSPVMV